MLCTFCKFFFVLNYYRKNCRFQKKNRRITNTLATVCFTTLRTVTRFLSNTISWTEDPKKARWVFCVIPAWGLRSTQHLCCSVQEKPVMHKRFLWLATTHLKWCLRPTQPQRLLPMLLLYRIMRKMAKTLVSSLMKRERKESNRSPKCSYGGRLTQKD